MMVPLIRLDGPAAPLPLANVDTDMILPARFMKTLTRKGLGQHLFADLRTAERAERGSFVLDRAPWNQAHFLIALENFGCGSSREHAPWALSDFGIRCIIAPSFADIFAGNCARNGILPLPIDRATVERLLGDASDPAAATLSLDLPSQRLSFGDGECVAFPIDPAVKRRLIEGIDDVDVTLAHRASIERHEATRTYATPAVPIDVASIRVSAGVRPGLPR